MSYLADLEIRKLLYGQLCELIQILDIDDGWKRLMNEVRSDCFNLQDRNHKYNINDAYAIETAAKQYGRPCPEIFLDEWGTSGRKRPTVRLLHDYLEIAKLGRAATYVAEKLMRDPIHDQPTLPIDSTCVQVPLPESNQEESTVPLGGNETVSNENDRFDYSGVTKVSFRVLERITNQFDDELMVGHGAFGSVYKGKEDHLEMAIKKLSRDATEHFQHELLILLTGIKHKNLLPPLAMSDEFDLCLVYEFMPNGSLEDRLALKNRELQPLSSEKRLSIALDTCEGLKYLHDQAKPIIHRDMKSSNILLDEKDVAKIADFGLIRIHNDSRTMNTSIAQGTTAYMAPEYFRGVVSKKLDVYSLGVILLELLTGLPSLGPEGHLFEYVDERIEPNESVEPVLDKNAEPWDVKMADKLFDLAKQCLEEKKKRPETAEVHAVLRDLVHKSRETFIMDSQMLE